MENKKDTEEKKVSIPESMFESLRKEIAELKKKVENKDDGSFYIKEQKKGGISRSGFLTINGKFDSTSTVSGIFTLTDYGEDKLKGSTKWKAYPKK